MMGRHRKERPDGIVFYASSMQQLRLLPDDQAGRVVKAAATLFLEGVEPSDLELSEQLVFSSLQADIEVSIQKFRDRCELNKVIADEREKERVRANVEATVERHLRGMSDITIRGEHISITAAAECGAEMELGKSIKKRKKRKRK